MKNEEEKIDVYRLKIVISPFIIRGGADCRVTVFTVESREERKKKQKKTTDAVIIIMISFNPITLTLPIPSCGNGRIPYLVNCHHNIFQGNVGGSRVTWRCPYLSEVTCDKL